MNKVVLMGRLTRDPDIRYTQGENPMCIARYTLAVDRRFARDNNNQQNADFISCIAFGKSGEFVEKYLKRGMKVAVTGRIQTGSYTNRDGQKVYTTDVVVEEHEFAESRNAGSGSAAAAPPPVAEPVKPAEGSTGQSGPRQEYKQQSMDGFMNIPDDIDEELPFQ